MGFHKASQYAQRRDFAKDRVTAKFNFLLVEQRFLTMHGDVPMVMVAVGGSTAIRSFNVSSVQDEFDERPECKANKGLKAEAIIRRNCTSVIAIQERP
ncbi:hypothetical protein [Pseudomonas amygdali]|uniref:hypothetical protein n=1 Tax=Pseudomonas amygdali TaxID=47877 RepID=UPI0013A52DF6|nr:hypothetical protein [Pseudomonas amygdali]